MSNEIESSGRAARGRWVGWLIVTVIVLLALGALFLPGLLRSATPPAAIPTVSSAPPPPTPSVWPTPTPGTTATAAPRPPVKVDVGKTAEPEDGTIARVDKLEAVQGVGDPGEVSGPAIRVTVAIENTSADPLSLAGTAVNLSYGPDDTPAPPVSRPGVVEFPASVAPGQTARGTYVFTVPLAERDQVRITLDLSATAPMVVFAGVGPK